MHFVGKLIAVVLIAAALGACGIDQSDERKERGDAAVKELMPVMTQPSRMAIGSSVVIGLKQDGTLWSWGVGVNGALGDGTNNRRQLTPTPLPGMTDFVEVSGRASHFLALRRDGTVWSWGGNRYGELGYPTEREFSETPAMVPGLKGIISVAAGASHSLALSESGELFVFGKNEVEAIASDKMVARYRPPSLVSQVPGAVSVVAGINDSAIVTREGEAIIWGSIAKDYTGLYSEASPDKGDQISIGGVRKVGLGAGFICVLMRSGDVLAMGSNRAGELGQGDFKKYPGWLLRVKGLPSISNISTTGHSVVAIDKDGRVWQWGASVKGPPPRMDSASPLENVDFPEGGRVVDVYNAGVRSAFLESGSVYFWGADFRGMRGTGRASEPRSAIFGKWQWTRPQKSLWSFN